MPPKDAVGSEGTVIHTVDGGLIWTTEHTGTTHHSSEYSSPIVRMDGSWVLVNNPDLCKCRGANVTKITLLDHASEVI